MRKRVLPAAAIALLVLAAASSKASASGAPAPSYAGYTAQSAAAEHDWEVQYRKLPDPMKAREYMQYLTAHPHWVGSPYGKTYPEWIQSQLSAWGLSAKIETFSVLFPSPKERVLELLGREPFRAKLAEPPVKGDPTSFQSDEQLPTYNAYGADGDVTAPAVYVNYGLPSDYETLARMGISVKGAIAIARYGRCWRGVKVTVAREHGALGCLLYSDPADDGYATNAAFPEGPARSPDSVQRGGVTENHYQGDPLTPGSPSIPGAPRIKREAADTIQKIPVLPISYADVQPFLEHLDGPIAPPGWRGALPITYRIGPGTTKLHLKVTSDWEQKNVYDVIATIPGSVHPDEWILRGNHHDAWTYGAFDPISGVVSLMEEARSLATLMKQGWRPKRTVVLCFWDGEEPANLGSTEWVEAHAQELKQHGAAYINTDASLRGVLGIEGSDALAPFIAEVAEDVPDPEMPVSVGRRKYLSDIAEAESPEVRARLRATKRFRIDPAGDGSDYAAFIDLLGIPTLDISFSNSISRGMYHSIYDDFTWYSRFGDPHFVYNQALAQLIGSSVMRLADADLLPFDFEALSEAIAGYAAHAKHMLDEKRKEITERNREREEGVFAVLEDSSGQRLLAAPAQAKPPELDFGPLDREIDKLRKSATIYKEHSLASLTGNNPATGPLLDGLNELLLKAGSRLTDDAGLPRRFWYKNQIYAPGEYTGYAANPLPGITDAIERADWAEAQAQMKQVVAAIGREAALLESANALVCRQDQNCP